eukprot:1104476-Pleurochrysis_carterae.AAC.1
MGKSRHRTIVDAQCGETMNPITVDAREQQAAKGRQELCTEGERHRAVERVGPGRRQRRVMRKSANEWPAVVGCGMSAHRRPPGYVSLSHDARRAGKKASRGCQHRGESTGHCNGHEVDCVMQQGQTERKRAHDEPRRGARRTRIEQDALCSQDDCHCEQDHIAHQRKERPTGDWPLRLGLEAWVAIMRVAAVCIGGGDRFQFSECTDREVAGDVLRVTVGSRASDACVDA